MLHALATLFFGLSLLSAALLVLGMIRPVWVLWFLDRSNRLLVIRIYGGMGMGFFILWKFFSLMLSQP
jgi:hypothetical protein